MDILGIVSGIVFGYICGGLVPGYWIGRYIFGKDLRREGSGNIGATNTFRVLGAKAGVVVFLLDACKGALAVWAAGFMNGVAVLSGLAAILGHSFSPFLGFRGGKGVATALGVFLCLAPKPALASFFVFVISLLITRRVSPSSCIATLTMAVYLPFCTDDRLLIAVTETVALLVLIRHRSNIVRLIRNEEERIF